MSKSEEDSVREYWEKVKVIGHGDIVDEIIKISIQRHYTAQHCEENVEPLMIRYYDVLRNELSRRASEDLQSRIGPACIGGGD